MNHSTRLVSLDLRPRVGVYSSENSPFAIVRPCSPYYVKFLQKRVGLFSRGYGTKVFVKILTFERSFSKLSEHHKIVDIGSKMTNTILASIIYTAEIETQDTHMQMLFKENNQIECK